MSAEVIRISKGTLKSIHVWCTAFNEQVLHSTWSLLYVERGHMQESEMFGILLRFVSGVWLSLEREKDLSATWHGAGFNWCCWLSKRASSKCPATRMPQTEHAIKARWSGDLAVKGEQWRLRGRRSRVETNSQWVNKEEEWKTRSL